MTGDDMTEGGGSNARILQRIADTLGIPVARFYVDAPPAQTADAGECLRLWSRLRTDAGRAAALAALRRILDEEQG